ncbi:hypothetical protein EGR_04560 [Echinococcus granulosus]|uniref:Uncharacterized protein n=1 Tax=Echinococcus granulosus TaxID=6210 RepID=W6UHJ9_ECHGR|nr:hypothetical protein EGR_04560 [Echinococcus granulosus]EUB60541.1 hypothetical protein EGR_04560 [Echinococcus granulosus]
MTLAVKFLPKWSKSALTSGRLVSLIRMALSQAVICSVAHNGICDFSYRKIFTAFNKYRGMQIFPFLMDKTYFKDSADQFCPAFGFRLPTCTHFKDVAFCQSPRNAERSGSTGVEARIQAVTTSRQLDRCLLCKKQTPCNFFGRSEPALFILAIRKSKMICLEVFSILISPKYSSPQEVLQLHPTTQLLAISGIIAHPYHKTEALKSWTELTFALTQTAPLILIFLKSALYVNFQKSDAQIEKVPIFR